jgi:nucleoid DNA-binding protein
MNGYVLVEDLMDKLYTSCKQSEAGERLASDLAKAIEESKVLHPTSALEMAEKALQEYVKSFSGEKIELSGLGRFSQ